MKKLIIPVVVILVLAFILTSCGGGTSAPPSSTAPQTTAPVTSYPGTTTSLPISTSPGSSSTPVSSPASKYGGTLRIIEVSAPGAPIGAEWEGNLGTYNTQQWCLERLLKEKLDGTMQPELAESWEVTSTGDSPNILFHLRKGVKFHDGTDFNAKAVAWNLDIFKRTGMFTATTNFWKSWDVIDDYTIRVNFTSWRNTLLRAWENYFFVSPTAYEKNGIEWMRTHMVGTGPFMQTDYKRDVSMTAVRFNDYWDKGKPYLDGVILYYVADELTREALMKSGGAEMLNATAKQAQRFQGTDFKILIRNSGPSALFPDSKNADSPWSNIKVRMAAEYAIDKESLAKTFGYGLGSPAYQMSSSATMAYDPALESQYRKYDPAKAKQLLAEAGYPNGFKTKILVNPGLDRDPVVAIQAYFAKVGIQAELEFPEPASWQAITTQPAKVNSLIYMPINEWSNYNTTLNVFFSDLGFYLPSLKKPEGWSVLFNKSLSAPAPDRELLKQVGDAFFNEAIFIPLVYGTFVYILTPNVQDSGLTRFGTSNAWDYANVWLSK